MSDILEGGWIDFNTLRGACSQVTTFKPTVLVVSHDQFNRYVNAFYLHGHDFFLKNEFRKLKINRLIWAEYLPDGEFELTSEVSWTKLSNVETLTIKSENDQ